MELPKPKEGIIMSYDILSAACECESGLALNAKELQICKIMNSNVVALLLAQFNSRNSGCRKQMIGTLPVVL